MRTVRHWKSVATRAIARLPLACRRGWSELGSRAWPGFAGLCPRPPAARWVRFRTRFENLRLRAQRRVPTRVYQISLAVSVPRYSARCITAMRLNGYFLNYSQSHNWPFKLGNRIPDTSYGKNARCSSPLSLLFKAFRKPLTLTPTLKQAHTSTQS